MKRNEEERRQALRSRAESLVAGRRAGLKAEGSEQDLRALLHELSVHQVELEMQNDELQEAQRRLEEARDGFARLYHQAPVGYLTLDGRGIIRRWNWTFAGMLGSSTANYLRVPLADLLVEEDREVFRARYPAFYRQPEGKQLDARLEGARAPLAVRLTARVLDCPDARHGEAEGHPALLVAVTDITRQKEAEEALRNSEKRWQYALEGAGDGVWDWHPATNRVFFSPQWQALLGDAPEEVGETMEEWVRRVHPDDRGPWTEGLKRHLDGETASFSRECRMLCRDGEYRWMQVRGKVMERGADGAPRRVIGTQSEITERKQTEARLMQAEKMESVGRLAGGVAHDFNNLLTIINGHAQLMLAKLGEESALRAGLEEIHKAGQRAAGLTSQLLAFSRKQVLQPRRLDLNQAVAEMRPMLERLVGESVEVRVALNAGKGAVHADPHQVGQVIMNLVANARDAMPRGGKLLIETHCVEWGEEPGRQAGRTAGSYVALAVSDSGTGMDEETRKRIFEPFFTTKGLGKGTGLGLSTVQGVVMQSGGHIDVLSEPGWGTRFTIYLPAAGEGGSAAEEPETLPAPGGEDTVLVVEDQQEVLEYTMAVLKEYGYRVLGAASAEAALRLCATEKGPIHLLVSDVVLPGGSGRELADRLSQLVPGMRVLFMSGYTDDVVVRHGVSQRGMHFLQKPFTPRELAHKVRSVLSQPLARAAQQGR